MWWHCYTKMLSLIFNTYNSHSYDILQKSIKSSSWWGNEHRLAWVNILRNKATMMRFRYVKIYCTLSELWDHCWNKVDGDAQYSTKCQSAWVAMCVHPTNTDNDTTREENFVFFMTWQCLITYLIACNSGTSSKKTRPGLDNRKTKLCSFVSLPTIYLT